MITVAEAETDKVAREPTMQTSLFFGVPPKGEVNEVKEDRKAVEFPFTWQPPGTTAAEITVSVLTAEERAAIIGRRQKVRGKFGLRCMGVGCSATSPEEVTHVKRDADNPSVYYCESCARKYVLQALALLRREEGCTAKEESGVKNGFK